MENTVGLWKEFATAERKRCERIAALPVMDVDPRLVAYTTELVKLRQQTAAISEASVREYEERSSLLDPERLGVDFVLSLAMHSNDGEAAIANALLDQASAKATDVRNLQARQNEIGDRFRTHAEQIEALNADEITLRSQLSQSFGREFPAGSTYPKSLPPNSDSAPSGVPAKDAVAKDLVGHRIDRPAWTFDSVREFQTLNVTYAKPANDVLRIAVQTRVRGILSGDQHDLSLRVTYRNQAGAWKWFSVAQVK